MGLGSGIFIDWLINRTWLQPSHSRIYPSTVIISHLNWISGALSLLPSDHKHHTDFHQGICGCWPQFPLPVCQTGWSLVEFQFLSGHSQSCVLIEWNPSTGDFLREDTAQGLTDWHWQNPQLICGNGKSPLFDYTSAMMIVGIYWVMDQLHGPRTTPVY